MNALSEYFLPLIFVVAIVVISLRKGMDKKKEEEMAKTTLPGHKSGEEIFVWEPEPVRPVQKLIKKPQKIVSKPLRTPVTVPEAPSTPISAAHEEDTYEPILNIEENDEIKKAIIYTEIFKRKDYY